MRLSFRIAAVCSAVLMISSEAFAEWIPGKRMNVAVTRMLGKAKAIMEKNDELYFADDTCLFAGFIADKESMTMTRTLVGGETYVFLGGGDNNAKDVDLELYNSNDDRVQEDTEDDPNPVIKFTPKKSGVYAIKMILQESKDGKSGSFTALVIMSTKGYNVPIDNLSKALGTLSTRAESICEKVEGMEKDLYFNSGGGAIALFGAVIPKGSDLTISKMNLKQSEFVAIASADATSKDIDLYVLDADNKVFKKDEDEDSVPVIPFTVAKGGSRAGLRVKNTDSKGPSFCMFALLKIVPQ